MDYFLYGRKRRHFRAVHIFAHMRKYVLRENLNENSNHYRLNGIRYKMRENMSNKKCHIGLENIYVHSNTAKVLSYLELSMQVGVQNVLFLRNRFKAILAMYRPTGGYRSRRNQIGS